MFKTICSISCILLVIGCANTSIEPSDEGNSEELGNNTSSSFDANSSSTFAPNSSSDVMPSSSSTPLVNGLDTAALASQWTALLEANIPVLRTYIKTSSFKSYIGSSYTTLTEKCFTIESVNGADLTIHRTEPNESLMDYSDTSMTDADSTTFVSDTTYQINVVLFWQELTGLQRPDFARITPVENGYSFSSSSMPSPHMQNSQTLILDLNFWPVSYTYRSSESSTFSTSSASLRFE